MIIPLGSEITRPLKISLYFQVCPVYRLTLAYSKGFSTIVRAIPDSIPDKSVLYSKPPVIGIYVWRKRLSCHKVLNSSKLEKNAEEWAAVPRIGGTIPLKKPMGPCFK